jgi:hypothetical protein
MLCVRLEGRALSSHTTRSYRVGWQASKSRAVLPGAEQVHFNPLLDSDQEDDHGAGMRGAVEERDVVIIGAGISGRFSPRFACSHNNPLSTRARGGGSPGRRGRR